MKGWLRLAAALAAAWLLCGCGAMRLAYENADSYVRWRVAGYLDLNGPHADELDERIGAFHAWHRARALPQYARIASEAARRLDDGVSPEDLVWGYDSLVAQARESLREAGRHVAPLLDRLDAGQLKHIEKGFAEDDRRFAREYLRGSEEDRRKRRVKRLVQRLEDWVGRLSESQLERVRQFAERVPQDEALRDRDRKRMQAQFLEIVRSRQAEARLPEFLARWREGRDPAYAAASEAHRRELQSLLLDLDRTLSPAQRERAAARFRRFAEDFAALAAHDSARAAAR